MKFWQIFLVEMFLMKIVNLSYFVKLLNAAIIPCKKGFYYYLVDLHVQDNEGKTDANGSGITIKSEDILELTSLNNRHL